MVLIMSQGKHFPIIPVSLHSSETQAAPSVMNVLHKLLAAVLQMGSEKYKELYVTASLYTEVWGDCVSSLMSLAQILEDP